jgi:lipopolysaccharide/colanic/teichoic acid biosynthesis glycosyltransferase
MGNITTVDDVALKTCRICDNFALKTCRRSDNLLRDRMSQTVEAVEVNWWALSRTNRFVSAILAICLILLTSPLWLVIALAIKLSSKGPVFFLQERTGYMGRRFKMLKFRTMAVDADKLKASLRHLNKHAVHSPDFKIDKDPRITSIGRLLRRYSLDELPNLINVVTGDMRLVGPRPTSFPANTYEVKHLTRLAVPSGITGLWQISGRSDIDFDKRVELDEHYIKIQSPWTDLKILLKTFAKVVDGHGAS